MLKRYLFCFLLFPDIIFGQSILTLEDAIQIALEQNFGIQIARMEQTAEAMQVYKSNAGMGPVIDWNTSIRNTGSYVKQNYLDGRVVDRWGRSINPGTNVSLDMTLYDGGRMQANFQRLGMLSEYSELEGKVIIQNTVVDVMTAYFEIMRNKNTVAYLNTVINYYQERLKITEERWNVGKGSKLDFLQSKTDMNTQLSDLTRAENDLKNAKVVLNGLLNRNPSEEFDISDDERILPKYDFASLEDQALNRNRDLLLLHKALDINRIREEEVAAGRKPQVSLNGNVGYAYTNTNTGFLTSNQNLSGTVGLSAVWNLYDGHHIKNQIAITKINSEIIEKQQESLTAQILNDLTFAFNQYQSDKELLLLEEENKEIAEENLSISIQKFRLGGSSILELNEAQRAYDTALNRLVIAKYNIQLSELALLSISGSLVE